MFFSLHFLWLNRCRIVALLSDQWYTPFPRWLMWRFALTHWIRLHGAAAYNVKRRRISWRACICPRPMFVRWWMCVLSYSSAKRSFRCGQTSGPQMVTLVPRFAPLHLVTRSSLTQFIESSFISVKRRHRSKCVHFPFATLLIFPYAFMNFCVREISKSLSVGRCSIQCPESAFDLQLVVERMSDKNFPRNAGK